MKRACVIGWPVSHSLSPVIHGYWLAHHAIAGSYVREAVAPKDLSIFLGSLEANGFCGANITAPHKIEAYRLCPRRDAAANAIGAVNTVWFGEGGLLAANTDAYGFLANLDSAAPGWDGSGPAVVVGAGGAARAVLWALSERGFKDIRIVNRTLTRAVDLSAAFPSCKAFGFDKMAEALKEATFVVNASTLGMVGAPPLKIDLRPVSEEAVICDLVYKPLETDLLRQARLKGLIAVAGLGMLLHQAVPGFEKWFGLRPEVSSELRKAVLGAIASSERPGG